MAETLYFGSVPHSVNNFVLQHQPFVRPAMVGRRMIEIETILGGVRGIVDEPA